VLFICDKIPDINNLRREKTYLGSWFQSIRVRRVWQSGAAHTMVNRKQRERETVF
jgi:hypothetical protein